MRNPRWAGTALIAVALAVTACGTGSAGDAYGGSGTPAGGSTTGSTAGSTAGGTAGGSQAMPASPSSGPAAALKTETTRAGTVLASGRGRTLYYYAEDKPHTGTSACTGACATAWPPLAAPVKAPAGVHLPGRLGVFTRPNGLKQVTLNGYPLYLYVGDTASGQAAGNGIGGSWHVIKIKS